MLTHPFSSFIPTVHTTYTSSTDPSKVTLPSPYVVCILGASRGIGAEIAYSYARAGASGIIISSRSTTQLQDVASKIHHINTNVNVHIASCDASSDDSVKELADEVKRTFGRLDVLISNAGFMGPMIARIDEGSPADFQKTFDVNAVGTYLAAHYFIPLLLASPNGARSFIAVSSLASQTTTGMVANAGYCISKLAQVRLVEMLAKQFHPKGLLAVAVHPGAVKTEMTEETPEHFRDYMVDEPNLCGSFCVWVTKTPVEKAWMSGRLFCATWDVDELVRRKAEIVERDLLKMRIAM
ncbi:hypothetical protein MMC14_007372 [Varicellaria rhodocarpa]|nr:hypothetical protein [Varicellaria rhodocarpa]